jgi:cytochrome b
MRKAQILRLTNPVMALLLIFQLYSGLEPAVIPFEIHRAAGLLLAAVVALHLALNWTWIRSNYLKR